MSITLETKQSCIIIENIQEPANGTGVDIHALRNGLGPYISTSHNARNNYDHHNNSFA
jgi:hypothetical protein